MPRVVYKCDWDMYEHEDDIQRMVHIYRLEGVRLNSRNKTIRSTYVTTAPFRLDEFEPKFAYLTL
jgi:hypothetical protein